MRIHVFYKLIRKHSEIIICLLSNFLLTDDARTIMKLSPFNRISLALVRVKI
jgi:hypothetical protein